MTYFLSEVFWQNPWLVAAFLTTLVAIIFIRYVAVAYIYNYMVKALTKSTFDIYKVKTSQIKKELRWSLASSVVFSAFGGFSFWVYQQGWTQIYEEASNYPIWYLLLSTPIILLLYETYYYWLHRWMHLPSVYRIVHKVHHQSMEPTVFTSFSFHPLEAILQAIFFPIVIFLVPLHYLVLITVLLVMTVSAVVNHSGMEIFHTLFRKHLIGSSHHQLHHVQFKTNFGLYFTWWDKWMKTEAKARLASEEDQYPV